jgi:asparagine synthase (glutamine-hydrolysing)
MCGIFALLNSYGINNDKIEKLFIKGKSRGPENSTFVTSYPNINIGFHRLAINGLNVESNQPIIIDGVVLICNGEIYNYQELYKAMPSVTPKTESDCEVIIHLYLKYGFQQTLQMLDGVCVHSLRYSRQ